MNSESVLSNNYSSIDYSDSDNTSSSLVCQKSFTEKLFSQLTDMSKIIIKQDKPDKTKPKNDTVLEYEKNDQLISRSESEHRIFVILAVLCIINDCILGIFVIISFEKFQSKLDLVPTKIPVQFNLPYLQAIFKNGSVFSLSYGNGTFVGSNHEFDLPNEMDYYLTLEYDNKLSYVHGRGNQKSMSQTFQNLHGFMRHKKHRLISKYAEERYEGFGFNNSISQIGKYLMFFGGGKNIEGHQHSK